MLSSLLLLFIQMFTIFTTSFPFALRCQHILFLYADNRRLPIFFYCIPFSHTFRCPCTAAVCWLLWHHLLITSIVVTRSFCLSLSPTHTHTHDSLLLVTLTINIRISQTWRGMKSRCVKQTETVSGRIVMDEGSKHDFLPISAS